MARIHRLVSHALCPYVQRAAIVAAEHGIALEMVTIDLAAKPDWFLAISPTGKVPLLEVREPDGTRHVLFESAPIAEYLDEISETPMLPPEPLARAWQRAWIEYASGTLAAISGLYGARTSESFREKEAVLVSRFAQVEGQIVGPWFAGERFGLVDAAFGPVFRYLDAFESLAGMNLAQDLVAVAGWRKALSLRPSVVGAVVADYPARLQTFLLARHTYISLLISAEVV